MKKSISAVISTIILSTSIFAFEWGGLITDGTKATSTDLAKENTFLQHSDDIALWYNTPVISDGSAYFAGQASFKNYVDLDMDFNDTVTRIINIDLLKLAGKASAGPVVISTALGRYNVSDLTGRIFNQSCDGILIQTAFPAVEISLYGGFTGLQNALTTQMLGAGEPEVYDSKKSFVAAHKYAPLSFALQLPSVFVNQTLNLQTAAFLDLEKTDYDRYYVTLGMNGPIGGPVYYSLTATGSTVDFKDYSVYGNLSLQTFISSVVTIKAGAEYASGSQFGLVPFAGFTSCTAYSSLFATELSGIILPSVDFILTAGNVYFGINGKLVLDYPEDDITLNGVSTGANFVWNIFSDLRFGLSGYYFLDLQNEGKLNNLAANTSLSLSF